MTTRTARSRPERDDDGRASSVASDFSQLDCFSRVPPVPRVQIGLSVIFEIERDTCSAYVPHFPAGSLV